MTDKCKNAFGMDFDSYCIKLSENPNFQTGEIIKRQLQLIFELFKSYITTDKVFYKIYYSISDSECIVNSTLENCLWVFFKNVENEHELEYFKDIGFNIFNKSGIVVDLDKFLVYLTDTFNFNQLTIDILIKIFKKSKSPISCQSYLYNLILTAHTEETTKRGRFGKIIPTDDGIITHIDCSFCKDDRGKSYKSSNLVCSDKHLFRKDRYSICK